MGWAIRKAALKAATLLALMAGTACDVDGPASSQGASSGGASAGSASGGAGNGGLMPSATIGGVGIELPAAPTHDDLGAACDPRRGVSADGSTLIVRDPEVLADFSLERVLAQLAESAQVDWSPEQLLQRLFDTENTTAAGVFADVTHCDAADNAAFVAAEAVDCPRAEGRLALSTGMLTPGHKDFFAPVALVNRFDLTPSDRSTCGEYRVVFAKQSGLTDPQERVFLIFEAALFNFSDSLVTCRPVAELWAGLSGADVATQKQQLSKLYFEGVGTLDPVLSVAHLGSMGSRCQYTGRCGQIRIGQGMQAPFQFRQFRLVLTPSLEAANVLKIAPTADTQSPLPQLFDLIESDTRNANLSSTLAAAIAELGAKDVARVRARTSSGLDAGESAVAGASRPNFRERLASSPATELAKLDAALAAELTKANQACPSDDPLTRGAIVERLAAVTCAGCHAPEQVLAEGRMLGCGTVWPKSQGSTHINELGELSPALTEVFLPYRAQVFSTFLQACDAAQVEANLQPVPLDVRAECFPAGTPITLANGSQKPIEEIEPAAWVLSFDPVTRTLLPAQVTQRVVRRDARRFVRINDALLATDNHPFFTENGWVRAEDLQLGAALVALDAESSVRLASVDQLRLEAGTGLTYNLRVAGHTGYFAAGLLVDDRP